MTRMQLDTSKSSTWKARSSVAARAVGAAALCLLGALGGIAGAVHAQNLYRIVGPDGKVTFTDQPPAATAKLAVTTPSLKGGVADTAALPYELRQATSKHPVTLYTTDKCKPCDSGRQLLSARGVPFAERTVTNNDDAQALQRLSGANSLPVLSVGSKQLSGFSDSEWVQALDIAGYPSKSALPTGYKNAPPQPMVSLQKTAPAEDTNTITPAQAESAKPATAPTQNNANPAGIVF